MDEGIEYSRQFYQGDDQSWIRNGSVNTIAVLAGGVSDLLHVGNGLGHAIYDEDENGYGRGAFIAMDVGRASGIAAILLGGASKFTGSSSAEFCEIGNKFPNNPDNLLSDLPRDIKGRIYPSDKIRIRPEQHPLEPGETFAPRHHGQHYHVETRIDPAKSWNNTNNVNKLKPPGYTSGSGTGFLPGEDFP